MWRILLRTALGLSLTIVFACGPPQTPTPVPTTPPPRVLVFSAISEGYDVPGSTGRAIFMVDGTLFYQGGRGFSLAKIDPNTGLVAEIRSFDTWAARDDGTALRAFMASIAGASNGTLLLIAVGDEAGLNKFPPFECEHWPYPWVDDGLKVLETLGSRRIGSYCYRDSWAMAVVKGEGQARAEKSGKGVAVSISVALTMADGSSN